GLQPAATLARRRALAAALNLAGLALVLAGAWRMLSPAGISASDAVILACIAIGAPWTIMGAWNAVFGLWLLHGTRDGLARAAPHLAAGERDAPIAARVAILLCLRHEDADRAFARAAEVRRSLDATGWGAAFDLHILSDSQEPAAVAAEEAAFARWASRLGGAVYRRRTENRGWKAGNIREFLRRRSRDYDLFLPLDSDSLMAGEAILRMTRIMQAHPRIGILQSLVVGAPSASGFARLFQFGMRHGMRSFTMGAAWWHGDCGPYWGHNALVRAAPFRARCGLPRLPGKPPLGGDILSHDQVEAALMRRAGYEVRVIPVEGPSWEDNPTTLMEFTRRDLRWCQGNMQYLRLLGLRGLRPMSRFQVFAAIAMYFGAPAWMLMTLAGAAKILGGEGADVDLAFGVVMFVAMFAMSLVPKVAGWLDVALTPGGVARYGGTLRFAAGAAAETAFSVLLAPVVALRVTIFLAGLPFGRAVGWTGQSRDAHALSWGDAARGLWPQTLMGLGLLGLIAWGAPGAIPWAAPVLAGLSLSIPFAVWTASPGLGRAMTRASLCAVPEERAPVPESLTRVDDALSVLREGEAASAGSRAA
ncbi:MAG: glucans biosynthesis glucosyltransferase MdoH, partial [Pseudomonadota bacterium]|nr:glucans biosynthesis glucosyltransferase MdoH [Pseudomonadota bacterium]